VGQSGQYGAFGGLGASGSLHHYYWVLGVYVGAIVSVLMLVLAHYVHDEDTDTLACLSSASLALLALALALALLALAPASLALALASSLGGGVGGACPPDVPLGCAGWLGWAWPGSRLAAFCCPGPPLTVGWAGGGGLRSPGVWVLLASFRALSGRFSAFMSVLGGPLGLFSGPFGARFRVVSGLLGSVSGSVSGGFWPRFGPLILCLGAPGRVLGASFWAGFGRLFGCFPGPLALARASGPKPVQQPLGAFGPCFSVFFACFRAHFRLFSGLLLGPLGPQGLKEKYLLFEVGILMVLARQGPNRAKCPRAQKGVFLGRFWGGFLGGFGLFFPAFGPSAQNPCARSLPSAGPGRPQKGPIWVGSWPSGPARPLLALTGPRPWPGFPVFGPFWPFSALFGPLWACRPPFGLYSKVVWGPPGPFCLFPGPLRGPRKVAVPWLASGPCGPKCTTIWPFWAPKGAQTARAPKSGGILGPFLPLLAAPKEAEKAQGCRLILGPGRFGPLLGPKARDPPPGAPFRALLGLFAPFWPLGCPVWPFRAPAGPEIKALLGLLFPSFSAFWGPFRAPNGPNTATRTLNVHSFPV